MKWILLFVLRHPILSYYAWRWNRAIRKLARERRAVAERENARQLTLPFAPNGRLRDWKNDEHVAGFDVPPVNK